MALAGDFKEILFADLLQFYCLSGQTAAVSVRAPDDRGVETTGTFFIDGGVLVDAVFDGREGSDAVRRAVRRLNRGAFQVEMGARSERRTVHEPWSALVLEELRQREGEDVAGGLKSAAPGLAAAFGRPATRTPTPSAGTQGGHTPAPKGRAATPPLGIRVTGTPSTPKTPTPSRGLPALPPAGETATRRTPSRGTPPVSAVERPDAVDGPAEALAVPRQHPGSGPHSQSPGSGPRRTPSSTTLAPRGSGEGGSGPRSAPATAPFSRIRREQRSGPLVRGLLLLVAALAVGGTLAFVAKQMLSRHPASAAVQVASVPAPQAPAPLPVPAATPGVTDTEVTFGMAAPFTGTSKELGRQMKVGLEVAFAAVNAQGGVHGRQLRLVALDDGYEPTRTAEVMRELAEHRSVFGFVGNVGTPTAAVALPYALSRQMLFFAPFTGAPLLRKDPPDRTVFNYRASYLEETAAIVRYLVEVRRLKPEQIAVFAQNDSFGEAGYQGVVRGLRPFRRDSTPPLRVSYERNTTDVATAVARILERKDKIKAVVMVASYRAAARFIEQVRTQRPLMIFTNVSFVGSQALAEELVQLGPRFADGVIVTQVVPLPTSRSTAVLRYQEALARFAPGERPDFISLEGYVDGNLLIEGLRHAGPALTTPKLVEALEALRGLDLGLATPLSFGPSDHQGSHKVWGTVLDKNGVFQALDLE